jgi:hypothetical protein
MDLPTSKRSHVDRLAPPTFTLKRRGEGKAVKRSGTLSLGTLALICLLGAGASDCLLSAEQSAVLPAAGPFKPAARGGENRWFNVPDGRLKGRLYSSATLSKHPVLIVVLHGDLPAPPPSYHYDFAQAATEGFDAVKSLPQSVRPLFGSGPDNRDLVAAALLRPGYTDLAGDRSEGNMGYGAGDNYTPRVVDDVAAAMRWRRCLRNIDERRELHLWHSAKVGT